MTLKEIITQISYRIDEEIDTASTDTDIILLMNKLKSSVNACYEKLAREKLLFFTKETITLENGIFNTEYLINKCFRIKRVMDVNGSVKFKSLGDNEYEVATNETTVTVYYYYIPRALEGLSDSSKFPKNVDDRILVYFASYDYLNKSDDKDDRSKAQGELGLYQDSYDNIFVPAEIIKVGGYIA